MPTNDLVALSDDNGILLLGDPAEIDRSLAEQGLVAKVISPRNVAIAGAVAQGIGEVLASSGRYVKLTPESAAAVKAAGGFTETAAGGLSGVLRNADGTIVKHLAFQTPGKAVLATPAAPIALGAMMTQLAIEQAISEVTDYLATIDAKLDKVLEHQQDVEWANLRGVELLLKDAESMREKLGSLPSTTWAQIQGTAQTLATCQAMALKKLDRLRQEVTSARGLSDTEKATEAVQHDAELWLGVLATAANLQDRVALLELDRVAAESPLQIEAHERALRETRTERLARLDAAVEALAAQMREAALKANTSKVLRPRLAAKIHDHHDDVRQKSLAFAEALELDCSTSDTLEEVTWTKAVSQLVEQKARKAKENAAEAATAVREVSERATDKVKEAGEQIVDKKDEMILRKAAAILDKDREPATDHQPAPR